MLLDTLFRWNGLLAMDLRYPRGHEDVRALAMDPEPLLELEVGSDRLSTMVRVQLLSRDTHAEF